jgi:putative lipoprotein
MSWSRNAVIGLAVLAMAWPYAEQTAHAGLAGSDWRVVEIGGRSVTGAGTLRFAEGKISGKAACNRYFATFNEAGATIDIGPIGSTRMYCHSKMELEREYLQALQAARRFTRDGASLVLAGSDGRTLIKLVK